MPSLKRSFDLISAQGPFGKKTDRVEPRTDADIYSILPPEDQEIINQVALGYSDKEIIHHNNDLFLIQNACNNNEFLSGYTIKKLSLVSTTALSQNHKSNYLNFFISLAFLLIFFWALFHFYSTQNLSAYKSLEAKISSIEPILDKLKKHDLEYLSDQTKTIHKELGNLNTLLNSINKKILTLEEKNSLQNPSKKSDGKKDTKDSQLNENK